MLHYITKGIYAKTLHFNTKTLHYITKGIYAKTLHYITKCI